MERDEDFRRNDREIDTHFSNDDGYLEETAAEIAEPYQACLLYTSPSPRDS